MEKLINYFKNLFVKYDLGLVDTKSPKDFAADIVAGEVIKKDLNNRNFKNLSPLFINQLGTDFCVGASRAYGGQATEKKRMSWAGAYAMGARYLGYIPKWGISIMAVCMGAIKYGTPEEEYWIYKKFNGLPKTGRNYFANWRNMGKEVLDNAEKHKAKTAFRIVEPRYFDRFDTFRAYLNKFHKEKIVIHTGVDAHAVTLSEQKKRNGEICLGGPDSYGKKSKNYRIGKSIDGMRWFTRAEANQLFSGHVVFDIERKLVEILKEYTGKTIKLENSVDCYLVKDGKKHLMEDEDIANSHGQLLAPYDGGKLVEIINEEDFNKIPTGEKLVFKGGVNEFIIRRIYERNKLKLKY